MTVVVVGAGVGGLACAHALVARGADVVVLESTSRPGGLLETERRGDWLCEWGANAFLDGGDGGAVALCEALSVPLVAASPGARVRWLFRDGRLRRAPLDPRGLLTTDLLSWRGKLRLLTEPLRRTPPPADESVRDFVARRFGTEAAEVLAGPLTLGVFAGEPDELTIEGAFPRLAALEAAHGSLVGGMIASARAARAAGTPRRRMASVAPVAGAAALPRALAKALGERVRLGVRVTRLERADGALTLRVADAGGAALPPVHATRVVLATPARVTAALCAPLDTELGGLADVPTARVALAFVGAPRAAFATPPTGFGVLMARGESVRALGIVCESEVWPDRAPAEHVLLRLIYGGAREPGAVTLADDALLALAQADVARVFGLRGAPTFSHVVRPVEGLPQPRRGHLHRVREAITRARALGLSLVGNAWGGVAVGDIVRQAHAVAAELVP